MVPSDRTARSRFRIFVQRSKNRRLRARTPVPFEGQTGTLRPPFPLGRALGSALVLLLGAASVGAAAFASHRWILRSPHFAIAEIRVSGVAHVSPGAMRARSGIALGENLFSVDLGAVTEKLRREPWAASVTVHRELPRAIAIDVVEREAAGAVALEAIYLVDARGAVFKRASPDEAASHPVLTGIPRDGYVHDRELSQALIREGLAALRVFRKKERFPVGEIHVDQAGGTTLYSRDALAVRLGRGDPAVLAARLQRLDAVLAKLLSDGVQPALVDVDQTLHPERVTVRLAAHHGG